MNQYHCLRYAIANGYACDEDDVAILAYDGLLELIQFAHEHGAPWCKLVCLYASQHGHLNCVQYAHEHGAPWHDGTCREAAKYGQLPCLQYARENGCPWHEYSTIEAAITNDQVHCLQYLMDHCPTISLTTYRDLAILHGSMKCLRFLHEQKGALLDVDLLQIFSTTLECESYILEKL
jgi:hypothetical protein